MKKIHDAFFPNYNLTEIPKPSTLFCPKCEGRYWPKIDALNDQDIVVVAKICPDCRTAWFHTIPHERPYEYATQHISEILTEHFPEHVMQFSPVIRSLVTALGHRQGKN